MRFAALFIVLLASALTTASGSARRLATPEPPPKVAEQWLADIRLTHQFKARPDRFEAPLARSRELSRLYPHHRLAVRTFEISAYILQRQQRWAEATREFVLTKRLALAARDWQTAAVAEHGLSNIYMVAGNIPGALELVRQAVNTYPDASRPSGKVTLQTQYARMLARSGRFEEAIPVFTAVIEAAEREGLTNERADAWKLVGRELALRGELDAAEHAINESLRMRHLSGDPEMASDYHDLADIRMRANRPADALAVLDLAELRISTAVRFPAWRLHLLRGRARLALGDGKGALADLRRAIRGIDSSPVYLLPGDLLRSLVARPTEAHEFFAIAALGEFDRTGNRRLLDEAFAVSEAGRAAALRAATMGPPIPASLTNRYWNIVADLDEANAQLLRQHDEAASRRVSQLRLVLAELETGSDDAAELASRLDSPTPLHLLRRQEALISFQLGEQLSLAWSLAGGRLEVTRLPARSVIQRQLQGWLDAAPGPDKQARAHELNLVLLAGLPPAVHAAQFWLVAADGELFQAPLASLVSAFKSSRPVYVTELHALQLIPGAWALERRQPAIRTGRFLGVGDPIYNEADPRRAFRWSRPGRDAGQNELPRLPGSDAELRACARYWESAEILLAERATPVEFSRALAKSPSVVHLAIHVVPAPDAPQENLLALGAGPEGRPSYVGPEWIGAHRLGGGLVMMNGCRSGSGLVTAGEGLMGLTRAWLRAGAARVVSTYWPTVDDGGAFTTEFYRLLTREGLSTAEALRRAQLTMIAQPDWRSGPQYWAAYFLIGYPDGP